MYEGNPVDLRMEKILSADGIFDDSPRQCKVNRRKTISISNYRTAGWRPSRWTQSTDVTYLRGRNCCTVPGS